MCQWGVNSWHELKGVPLLDLIHHLPKVQQRCFARGCRCRSVTIVWGCRLMSAYAWEFNATGSVAARDRAWAHFRAVEFLHNVTDTRGGFFARTAVKCGEQHQVEEKSLT